MYSTIRVFLRFISFYICFSMVLDVPDNVYWLIIVAKTPSNLPFILSILAKVIYYLVVSLIIWFAAPWMAKKICSKFKNDKDLITNALLHAGLLLLGIKFLFEKSITLLQFVLTGIFMLKNSSKNYTNVKNNDLLAFFMLNPTTITTSLSIVIIILYFVYRKKVEAFLIK